ncbi:hypothetical protein AVEN_68971-1 [Araneus ventricosus]|uniref:DDE-1 domain-containing protein n=1 Tax=Araneus ventricosus TaxID=182803 RepID=A0A4Y2IEE6_ARAVE|nr:hypothetical protein AVEN_68971-1 [Araneus ventricosus]
MLTKDSNSRVKISIALKIGMTKVPKPSKTIVRKGTNIGSGTSVERGTVVIMALAVDANRDSVPSFFPRKHFKHYFHPNASQRSKVAENKSVWVSGQGFQRLLRHFIKHTRVTKERPVLLLLETINQSDPDLPALDLPKKAGLFSFFTNYIFVKTLIQTMIMMITHKNNL